MRTCLLVMFYSIITGLHVYGMLHSKSVRQLDQWDLRDLETLGP